MSELRSWLDGRRPRPPMELASALLPTPLVEPGEPPAETLSARARERLAAARARPGRVRDSAFDLLAADALVTYACEAALDEDHPEAMLRRLLSVGEGG